jgi:ABC-type transport system substrate-binding protein
VAKRNFSAFLQAIPASRARHAVWGLGAAVLFSLPLFLISASWGERALVFALFVFLGSAFSFAARRWGTSASSAQAGHDAGSPVEVVVRKITEGDLTDELFYGPKKIHLEGSLYFAARKMVLELRRAVGKFHRLSREIESAGTNLLEMTDSLSFSAREQGESVADVHRSLESINSAVTEIRENIHYLMDIVGDTSSAVLEMTANIEEVTDSAKGVTSYVEETATAMEEMAANVSQVAEAGQELYARASDNAASMAEMDTAIEEVGESTKITAELSDSVKKSAAEGRHAVQKTSEGLRNIEQSVGQAVGVISALGKHSVEIGKIVKVIKDIADQTNLLALNAAILAAQAGKEGRGFAVVAEEIRELSERTTSSVSEIATMVKSIQREATKAVDLMEATSRRVQDGVTLGSKAEESLQVIQERTELAVANVEQIAKATQEQILGSRRITASIDEMANMIERITSATQEQADTSQKIKQRTAHMADATAHIFRAMEEQMSGSKSISESMERLNSVVNGIEDSVTNLSRSSETVLRAVEVIKEITGQNIANARNLYATVSSFRQEALVFRDAIAKFRLPQPRKGGTLRMVVSRRAEINLDPAHAQTVVAGDLVYNLYDGLVRFGEGTDIHPALARKWNVSSDGLVYTFHLRENLRFHDGSPVTAHDVKASFERVLKPENKFTNLWVIMPIRGSAEMQAGRARELEGVRVVNEHTVEITLSEPVGFFLSYLTLPEASILPAKFCHQVGTQWNQNAVGSGPFRLAAPFLEGSAEIVLTRNPHYFRGDVPHLDEIRILLSQGEDANEAELLRQDKIDVAGHAPAEEILEFLRDPVWAANVHSGIQLNTTFIGIRNDVDPFTDRRVRQALNYAVNKQGLNQSVHGGLHEPAKGILPPGMLGFNPELRGYPYDPDKARALLKEAGFPGGIQTYYYKRRHDRMNSEILYVLSSFAEVGVEVEIRELDDAEFRKHQKPQHKAPLFFSGWYADYPDPDNFFYSIFHSSSQGLLGLSYINPRVDMLMEEARRESDINVRERLYRKAEDIVVEDAPLVFLMHQRAYVIGQSYVGGIRLNLTPPVMRPEDLWIEQAR